MSHWSSINYIHPRHHTVSSVPCPNENQFCFLIWRKQLQEGKLQHFIAFPARSTYNLSSWRPKNSPFLLLQIPSSLEGSPNKSTDFSCSKTERRVRPAGLHTSHILSLKRIFLHGNHLLPHAHVQVNSSLWWSSLYLLIYLRIPFLFRHYKHFCITCNCFWQFVICWRCTAVACTPVFINHLWNLWTK